MRTFLIIWFGQLISLIGSGLSGFALGVYLYEQTGAVTQLALSLVFGSVPYLVLLPVAGALVDRWDRRTVLILSDTGAALVTVALWALVITGQLQIWHVYLGNAIASAMGAFQRPAYMGLPSLLVPREQYGRVSGLSQVAEAASTVLSPVIAGFLMITIRIQGVFLVDFATYLFAVGTLLLVRIPRPTPVEGESEARPSVLREATFGWQYIRARRGLLGMLLMFTTVNFALGFYSALFNPLVLSRFDSRALGSLLSLSGLGMLGGSLLMSVWGGTRRRVYSLLGGMAIGGLSMALVGLRPNLLLIGAGNLLFFAIVPIANASSQAIWLAKIPAAVQGRVFAARMMLASAITPIAYLVAGPLADRIAEPLMAEGGGLASLLGPVLGTGTGRGYGLIIAVTGLLISVTPLIGALVKPIRRIELELPDAPTVEQPAGQAAG